MPLIEETDDVVIVNNDTDPGIPQGEWYRLRRVLGWKKFDGLNKIKALKIEAPNMFGNRGGSEKMDVSIDLVTLHEAYLKTYLLEWSFPQPITPDTIGKIDPQSKNVLIEVIEQLQDEQMGVLGKPDLKGNLTGYANVLPSNNHLLG